MNRTELAGTLERVGESLLAIDVLERARVAADAAPAFWLQDHKSGHLDDYDISAAQVAAMELSLIVDGALFLLHRAPTDGPRFGLLSERALFGEKRRAGFRRGSRRGEPDAVELFRHRQRARAQRYHPPSVRLRPFFP